MTFAGRTLELRGFLRTEDVTDFAGLWMREDDASGSVAFDNMQGRQLKGTTDWTEYSISLPLKPDGKRLSIGVLNSGAGKVWADDLRLLVDGKPVWDAPKRTTILDSETEFDSGSKVSLTSLNATQTENLVTLGKVWGFLKYHHPEIVSGRRHWDYDLFRVLPGILAAADRASANAALLKWIAALGEVKNCEPCVQSDDHDVYLRSDLGWIADERLLGSELSRTLQTIHRNRTGKQFYVSKNRPVGNPSFDNELGYSKLAYPDAGFQVLGLFRFWNIVAYWFPYRDVIGENWDDLLAEYVPKAALARDGDEYARMMMTLVARIHDTHAQLWSSLRVRPPVGTCQLPVYIRFVEKVPVVVGYASADRSRYRAKARRCGSSTGWRVRLRLGGEVEALLLGFE